MKLAEARALVLLRANVLAKGHSGIREETLDLVLALLERNCIPVVPERGSVGASGDLAPLAHLVYKFADRPRDQVRFSLTRSYRSPSTNQLVGQLNPTTKFDINQANEAELDSIKGMGPALSAKVLKARAQGPFKDWSDVMQRVSGIRQNKAQQLSEQGLTVNGEAFSAKNKSAQRTST